MILNGWLCMREKLQNNSNLCRVVIRGASRFMNLVKIYDYWKKWLWSKAQITHTLIAKIHACSHQLSSQRFERP